jgi:broad specificity phosphatase PhoE
VRIYLIRHADPDYPNNTITPAGHLEAHALAEHLADAGIDELYSSPVNRAALTAGYIAERLQLPVTVEPWASELSGLRFEDLERVLWDLDGALLRSPELLSDLSRWEQSPLFSRPAVQENLLRVRQGSDEFLARQGFVRRDGLYTFERENRKKIVLVAHLGFGLAWLSYLLDIPLNLMWAGFFLPPSSVTTILFDERAPGVAAPRVLGLGDTSHLSKAGLQALPSGIISNYF